MSTLTAKRTHFPRTTASQRKLLFHTWQTTGDVKLACSKAHVSERTFYKWKHRFNSGGYEALEQFASHAPKTPHRTTLKVEQKVIELRRTHPKWGKRRIADEMTKSNNWVPLVSPNTVRRILIEAGLWTQLETEPNAKKPPLARTADKPGQTVNIDLCFVPATHELTSKLPAVSGSSGRLVVERTIDKAAKEEPQWPGRIFEDQSLTYEEAMAGFVTASANKSEQAPTQKSPEAAAAAAVLAQKRQIRQEEEALRAERRIIRAQRIKEDQAWEAIGNQRRAEQAAQEAAQAAQEAAQEATQEAAAKEAAKATQAAQETAQEAAKAAQEVTKEAAKEAAKTAQAAQETAQEATKEAAKAAQAAQEAAQAAQAAQEATLSVKSGPYAATLASATTLTKIESATNETNNLSTLSAQSAVESHHTPWDAPTETTTPSPAIWAASSTDLRIQITSSPIKTNNLPAESAPSIVKNSNLPVQHATAAGAAAHLGAQSAGAAADLAVESETSDHKSSDSPAQATIDKSSNLPSENTTFVTMSADLVIKAEAAQDESISATNRSSAQATEATIESITQIAPSCESKKSKAGRRARASGEHRTKEAKTASISEAEVKAKSPSISDPQWRQLKLQRRVQKQQRKQENVEWRQKRNSILQRLGALPFITAWVAILVIVDNCTRQCISLPLFMVGPHVTAQMIVEALREVLPPSLAFLISDRGVHFRANVFSQFCQMSGFQHVLIAKHRPQSNGIAERFVRTLKEWLADKSWTSEEELIALLAEFREYYNERPHQGIAMPGLSPNEYAKRIWVQ